MKRLTKQDFIERARAVHGDKYDYSKVEYVNNSTKVVIICPVHGEFLQTPNKHMQGRGCPCKDCIDNKRRASNMARYGVANAMQSDEVKESIVEHNREKYGVNNVMQVPEIQERLRQSNLDKYGVACNFQLDSVREKIKATNTERYGGNSPMCSSEIRQKAADTMMELYGVEHALCSDDLKEKARNTVREHYGVYNPMYNADIKYSVTDSKRENNTFHTSEPEEKLYQMLCDRFGEKDILRQAVSGDYPYACDFYVKSRHLYIELNASWTHGHHWFDEVYDLDELYKLKEKAVDSEYYATVLYTWTDADVRKRNAAREHHLNYVVFWDQKMRDVTLWFAMGCPDGQDYDKMYSWLPDRVLSYPALEKLTGQSLNLSQIAKAYQFDVFYQRELQMWSKNKLFRGTTLQVYLYYNRYQYLGKLPCELSDIEILNGFKISGILRGYTRFDVSLMDQVVKKYNITSIYDPCAGWGERMLYCKYYGITYYGIDINELLEPGYQSMMDAFDIQEQHIYFGDSALTDIPDCAQVDAVMTCPPYGSTEIYSDTGSENLNHNAFRGWWSCVVERSLKLKPKYFCFQINQAWKSELSDIVMKYGFVLLEELVFSDNKSSHFTRKQGVNLKREYESMLVFERV